jgi:hypothetical protein
VFRVNKIFKMHLVGRSSFSSKPLSFSAIKFLISQLNFSFGASQNIFFVTQITPIPRPSINLYKLLGNFSDFFCSLFPLVSEHSLIFRCSKISFHVFQILYLGSSCSIMSLGIFFLNFRSFRSIFRGLNNNSRFF